MTKRRIFICLTAFVFAVVPTFAQKKQSQKKQTLSEKFSKYVDGAKKSLERVGHQIDEAVGVAPQPLSKKLAEIKIDGNWYMPLYKVNLYHGQELEMFKDTCLQQFTRKYPHVHILSTAIPQEGWISESVKDKNKIIGYLQTLYCYITAKDGNDGYINACFAFKRYKDVGKEYGVVEGAWPKWERTDVLTNEIYDELLTR